MVWRGSWAIDAGKLIGRWPDGSTSPDSTRAIASPPAEPGYQASTMPAALAAQGVSTGPPVSSTTTVLALAAVTASISLSWLLGRVRSGTSRPSPVHWLAKTRTTSLRAASLAASVGSLPSLNVMLACVRAARARSGEDGSQIIGPGKPARPSFGTGLPPTG